MTWIVIQVGVKLQVRWSFIPDGATEEEEIPSDVGTSSPSAAPATAFLYIENPVKRHEGQYICRIGQAMDVAKLIVEDRSMYIVENLLIFYLYVSYWALKRAIKV